MQEQFLRKAEQYKDSFNFREQSTNGGFYTRDDMIKKVVDGGLGFSPNLSSSPPMDACKVLSYQHN